MREDAAHRDVDVDVAAAVQRVEDEQVLAARVGARDLLRLVHLLAGHAGQVAVPLVHADEDLVAQHVQRLLHLALHVESPPAGTRRRAQRVAQLAEGDDARDGLAGQRDVEDQRVEVAAGGGEAAALLDQVAREGPAVGQAAWRVSGGRVMQGRGSGGSRGWKTRLARMSAAVSVVRSSAVSTRSRSANRRLAWRSRARSSALRTLRALAKCGCCRRSAQVFGEGLARAVAEAVVHAGRACGRRSAAARPARSPGKSRWCAMRELMPGLLLKKVSMRSL